MIELTTERLVLKTPQAQDKWALVEHLDNYEVTKWLSNVPYPYSVSDAEDWIQRVNNTIDDERPSYQLSIFLSDALIGGVGLRHIESGFYELGYWLSATHWGRGFATEAATELLRYGHRKLSIARIRAHCMKGNLASENVLRKLGFEVVGEVEDYSVSRKESVASLRLSLP